MMVMMMVMVMVMINLALLSYLNDDSNHLANETFTDQPAGTERMQLSPPLPRHRQARAFLMMMMMLMMMLMMRMRMLVIMMTLTQTRDKSIHGDEDMMMMTNYPGGMMLIVMK